MFSVSSRFGMSVFERNLEYLQRTDPGLAALAAAPQTGLCRLSAAANGQPSLLLNRNGTDYWLHSRFDPGREALTVAGRLNRQAQHIVVYGLGLGYLLQEILRIKKPEARVLLLEPEADVFRCALQVLDWRVLVEEYGVYYLVGSDWSDFSEVITAFIDLPVFSGLEHVELASETRLMPEVYQALLARIEDEVKILLMDFVTLVAEKAVVPRNILRNLERIFLSRPAAALKDLFRGSPGIIVSAGPSLDRNLLQLKSMGDRALIVCVDTALKTLLAQGLQPHFTVVADPSFRNYLHVQGTAGRLQNYVLAESGVNPQVFKDFAGRTIAVSLGKPLMRLLESRCGFFLGEMTAWGSVISLAVQFAAHLGLDPLIFVGQDFAYSDNRNHCRHTSWEEEWMATGKRLDEMQRKESASIAGNSRLLESIDVNGNRVFTSERLLLYKKYLVNQLRDLPQTKLINASEGGILTEIPCMTLRRVILEYIRPAPRLDLFRLEQIPVLGSESIRALAREFCRKKRDFFQGFLGELTELNNQLQEPGPGTNVDLLNVLEKSEKLANRLYQVPENGEMVEFWSRAPVFKFLREGRAANSPEKLRMAYLSYFQGLADIMADMVRRFAEAAGESACTHPVQDPE